MKNFTPLRLLLLVIPFCCICLNGCARYADLPAGTAQQVQCSPVSPVVEKELVAIPPMTAGEQPPADYLVGPGDVLFISVFGRPELSSVVLPNSKLQGSRVD